MTPFKVVCEHLVPIASAYHKVLEPYMQTQYGFISNAKKRDKRIVALQEFEFWCSICDEEIGFLNILKLYWHCREEATYAFGSILEG